MKRCTFMVRRAFQSGSEQVLARISSAPSRSADGKVYQIKGNSMISLVVNGNQADKSCANPATTSPCTATFNGKASIQDITNPNLPVSVEGNATIRADMKDTGNSK